MREFKAGDRVRCIKEFESFTGIRLELNKIYMVFRLPNFEELAVNGLKANHPEIRACLELYQGFSNEAEFKQLLKEHGI